MTLVLKCKHLSVTYVNLSDTYLFQFCFHISSLQFTLYDSKNDPWSFKKVFSSVLVIRRSVMRNYFPHNIASINVLFVLLNILNSYVLMKLILRID